MTISSVLLRQSRRAVHLSQRAAASAAHVPQASIGRVEAGSRDVSVATLDAFLRPTGNRHIAVPLRGRPVAESAVAVADALDRQDESAAFREFIQTNDDLVAETPAGRVVLSYAPPPPTGDRRFDALLAALVDYRLNENVGVSAGLEPPTSALLCNAGIGATRGLTPTPRQWGFDIFRTWRF